MTKEEFRSKYFYKELKCKKCGEPFKRCFPKDSSQSVIDLYTNEDAPVFCDECWENGEMDQLIKQIEEDGKQ